MTEALVGGTGRYYRSLFEARKLYRRTALATFGFAACLFICLGYVVINITYTAAAPNDDPNAVATALAAAADGSSFKKIMTLALFGFTFALAGWRLALSSISIPYRITIVWCLMSALWAIDPNISIRRTH